MKTMIEEIKDKYRGKLKIIHFCDDTSIQREIRYRVRLDISAIYRVFPFGLSHYYRLYDKDRKAVSIRGTFEEIKNISYQIRAASKLVDINEVLTRKNDINTISGRKNRPLIINSFVEGMKEQIEEHIAMVPDRLKMFETYCSNKQLRQVHLAKKIMALWG